MLVASKSGLISVVDLIEETKKTWVVMDEKVKKTISKTDPNTRSFNLMSDALKWVGAEPELIQTFLASEAKSDEQATKH
ncbi:hypothetical protein LCG56_29275 (plasmid) [Pseudomonas cannabina pv. alisalensis]|uniref:Uncharacterized protein n=1 Tax=Pseudomonas syringae pv. maculicola str. ES4326 TaxID=629265 RepID=A0A8T8C9V7_PSEYM|nr:MULTISPECIES: hypothetical protein [Pseudomonas syringae group]QHF00483.1 hypothetical protein PMA4326_028620 [Pseudomonas syringae pv. maculicola str. ES4326]UBZ00461.1 hypothetical protein LCG56_29275 [Pseudomonas cannabina pv. alisalensis]